MNFKNIFLYATLHSIKISYIALALFSAIVLMVSKDLPYEGGYLKNYLIICGVLFLGRLIFGGWSSSSLKGMCWQAVMSTIGALIVLIWGMKSGGGIHFLPIIIVLIVSIAIGILCYSLIDDLLTEATDIDADGLVDSVFTYGLKNTFNGLMDVFEGNLYYAASRGVAAYSNTVLFLGLIVGCFYM